MTQRAEAYDLLSFKAWDWCGMVTPRVDLSTVNQLIEIVVRAGDVHAPDARKSLQDAYARRDVVKYPDAPGISTLFRPGATLDELALEGSFPHRCISFSVIGKVIAELAAAGSELVLFVTPAPEFGLPDHHSLAVAQSGAVADILSDAAADALIRALIVIDNPYRQKSNP